MHAPGVCQLFAKFVAGDHGKGPGGQVDAPVVERIAARACTVAESTTNSLFCLRKSIFLPSPTARSRACPSIQGFPVGRSYCRYPGTPGRSSRELAVVVDPTEALGGGGRDRLVVARGAGALVVTGRQCHRGRFQLFGFSANLAAVGGLHGFSGLAASAAGFASAAASASAAGFAASCFYPDAVRRRVRRGRTHAPSATRSDRSCSCWSVEKRIGLARAPRCAHDGFPRAVRQGK